LISIFNCKYIHIVELINTIVYFYFQRKKECYNSSSAILLLFRIIISNASSSNALRKSEAEIPRENLTYMSLATAFREWDSFWDLHCEFIAILYGSTPTIISLRLVSGTRWPRGFDRDTMQGALSVPVVSRCRSQRLSDLEL